MGGWGGEEDERDQRMHRKQPSVTIWKAPSIRNCQSRKMAKETIEVKYIKTGLTCEAMHARKTCPLEYIVIFTNTNLLSNVVIDM